MFLKYAIVVHFSELQDNTPVSRLVLVSGLVNGTRKTSGTAEDTAKILLCDVQINVANKYM